MPKPISRRKMIRRLRAAGWSGPWPSRKHMIMQKGDITIHIPNPHGSDIDWSLTKQIIKQANIDPEEWERLGD